MEETNKEIIGIELDQRNEGVEITLTFKDNKAQSFIVSNFSKGIEFWKENNLWKEYPLRTL